MSGDKILPELKLKPDDGKVEIRRKVWDYLEDNHLALFPRPAHRRISNFRGSDVAGELALGLDVFKNATSVFADPERPLQYFCIKTLKAEKMLFVPSCGFSNHVLNELTQPEKHTTRSLRAAVSRQGMMELSEPVGIDSVASMDLIVFGSVAVSPKGWRIGKGQGLADLEYAMMVTAGLVGSKVTVMTLVHDCQVIDLQDDLFGPHDVPVDCIVTPTRVIWCADQEHSLGNCRPFKPPGIVWSLLGLDDFERVPVLRRIRYREWKSGKDVRLSGEETGPTDLEDVVLPEPHTSSRGDRKKKALVPVPRVTGSRNFQKIHREKLTARGKDGINGSDDVDEAKEDSVVMADERKQIRRRRRQRQRRSRIVQQDTDSGTGSERSDDSSKENRVTSTDVSPLQPVEKPAARSGRRNVGRRRMEFAGSVYVGSLPHRVRVSELKAEVRSHNVNPLHVLWRGSYGFAFLNFRTLEEAELALEALNGLQVKEKSVRLEMAHGRVAPAAAADVANTPQWSRQSCHSRQSNGETTNDSATSDDTTKRDPEPCDVEDIQIEVEDA